MAEYFTDEDYCMASLPVQKLPRLEPGRECVSEGGVIRGVKLECVGEGRKKNGDWNWFKTRFVGTKALDGLRVMVALNNWDLKEVNNFVYGEAGQQARFAVSDLGATFGRTGNTLSRSKSNVNVPYYLERTGMQNIAKDIPLAHAKWMGGQNGAAYDGTDPRLFPRLRVLALEVGRLCRSGDATHRSVEQDLTVYWRI
jgi:hypothetical protein